MSQHYGSPSDAPSLAGLLRLDDEPLWRPDELGAILSHQLDAPLGPDLAGLDARFDRQLAAGGWAEWTFRQLLADPAPPVELLELTKRFAKRCRTQPEAPLPGEVATALYLAAIVAARLNCAQGISRLDDTALRQALQWVADQNWLDPVVAGLFARIGPTLAPSESDGHA